jgi:outer membrane protein assembly factor BamE
MKKIMGIFRLNRFSGLALLLTLGGCSSFTGNYVPQLVKPHKIDIQQGNVVTQQDVDRVQIGMSKEQVRFILGTPLLNSPFHTNRWDYVYRLTKADGSVVQYMHTVVFENDKLARQSSEKLPDDQSEFLSGPNNTRPAQ